MPDFRRRAVRESMTVRLDVSGMLSDAIGADGLTRAEVEGLAVRAAESARALQARRAAGELPVFDLPQDTEMVRRIGTLAAEVRQDVDTLVVLGIGGSALGSRAILEALSDGAVRVEVADNVDPWSFGRLLDSLDLTRTAFNVVSKSGETAATMAQFLIVRDRLLRALGAIDYKTRVIVTTDGEQGSLRQIVNDEGFRDLVVPSGVTGRFSVLTAAGLFPAAVAGVRIEDLLAGAGWMDSRLRAERLGDNPAHLLAALLYLAEIKRHKNVVVLMPYSDRLRAFARWFAQLWAESLAKSADLEGNPSHSGQTPVPAVGATDQHAQLQLYLDGPPDKVVVFLRVEDHGREIEIPSAYGDLEGVGYLSGKGLGALLNMEQRSTELGLQRRGRMAMTLALPQLNAFTLGQLFYLFEAATVYAGALHRVNSWDQPAADEGRRLTFGLAGRKGWQDRAAEVEEWLAGKSTHDIV
ncbi:MAG: glucose-6-phosphate isomerase [Candidatus Binatia bacterium]